MHFIVVLAIILVAIYVGYAMDTRIGIRLDAVWWPAQVVHKLYYVGVGVLAAYAATSINL